MKKIITAIALAGALSLSVAAPAAAAKVKDHPRIQDGSAGYHLACGIGWMLGIQMCHELMN